MRSITLLVRGSRRVSIGEGPFAIQTEPKPVSTAPGVGMGIDVTAPGAGVVVTAPGDGVATEVGVGPAAGAGAAAWQASRVSRHGAVAPILTQVFAVLLSITMSSARADRSRRGGL